MGLFGLSGVTLANFVWIMILFCIAGVFWGIKIMYKKNYPIEVIIHHNSTGGDQLPVSNKDRGRFVTITPYGDKALYLKKHKVFRFFSGRFVGMNRVAYAIVRGNWYNIGYNGLDEQLRGLNLEPLDSSNRLHAESIKTQTDKMYQTPKTNKILIFGIIGALIFMGLSGYIFYKMSKINTENAQIQLEIETKRAAREETWALNQLNITESLGRMIAYTSQITSGSGAIPA